VIGVLECCLFHLEVDRGNSGFALQEGSRGVLVAPGYLLEVDILKPRELTLEVVAKAIRSFTYGLRACGV
jgi:hypothetical protein